MLPELALPSTDALPDPVGQVFYGDPTGSLRVEIDLVRGVGRPGAAPELTLNYAATTGDGVFGRHWSLSVPSISRGTGRRLPRYRDAGPDADGFTSSRHGEVVPALLARGSAWAVDSAVREGHEVVRFRPRVEADFPRIERWRELATGEVHWRETSPDDIVRVYGRSAHCRIANPLDPLAVAEWLLEEERDPRGHVTRFVYKREDSAGTPEAVWHTRARGVPEANLHLKRVLWGNARADRAGEELFELVFDYGEHEGQRPTPTESSSWPLRSDPRSSHRAGFALHTRRLCRRALLFHRIDELGPTPTFVREFAFSYDETVERSLLTRVVMRAFGRGGPDDREQLPALEFGYTDGLSPGPLRELTDAGVEAGNWIDLEANGLPGRLRRDRTGALGYRANLGDGRLAPETTLPTRPAIADQRAADAGVLAQPFADARTVVMDWARGPSYHDRDLLGRWSPHATFGAAPTSIPTAGRAVDADGDGLTDTIGPVVGGVRCLRFAGRDGWTTEERVGSPAVGALQDRTGTVLVADMTGDGLADLVRVRPGSVSYWPNLGHGRFGEEVTMRGAPMIDGPEGFDSARVRLIDLDGTGPADLLYLGREGVVCFANHAGNGFGGQRRLPGPGPIGTADELDVFDLTGAGAPALVYSKAGSPDQFVELTSGAPAHFLAEIRDGAGLTTTVTYTTTARLMAADRSAGRPWATTVPFPMPVVAEVRQTDEVTGGAVVSRFKYRHGCYDDVARELRGFGYFARRDSEMPPPDPDAEFELPPPVVRETRRWFHAGLGPEGIPVVELLSSEFSVGDPTQPARPQLDIEPLPGVAARELVRAVQGRPVREEVYGLGDDPASVYPRRTTDYGYVVRALQPPNGPAPPAVVAFERESVARTYEQIPDDPRVEHDMALELDSFGNVTRAATVHYARRRPEIPEQERPQAVVTERMVLNRPDDRSSYRLGLPTAERRYEIGPLPPPVRGLHRIEDVSAFYTDPRRLDVPFEDAVDPAGPAQRRLVEASDVRYWSDDPARLSPQGQAGRLALPATGRKAVLTSGLARAVYGDAGRDLADAGYHAAEGLWWADDTLVRYDLAAFALPASLEGPLRGPRSVRYDRHALLPIANVDEIGNEERATPDYRALALTAVRDANGTTRTAVLDPLGLPRTVAASPPGRDPPGPPTIEVQRNLNAWERSASAPNVHLLTRAAEGIRPDDAGLEVRLLDGRGREVERIQRAEPDPVGGTARWASQGAVVRTSGKGIIRQYAPDWCAGPRLRPEHELRGAVTRTTIDELERAIGTVQGDGARSRTVRTAWRTEEWDAVDDVRGSAWESARRAAGASSDERSSADAAAALAGTPTVEMLDPAGRVVERREDLGGGRIARTAFRLNVDGEPTAFVDARGVEAEARVLDMLGNAMSVRSSASGETRTIYDAEGRPLIAWGARGQRQRQHYDAGGRLVERTFATPDGWRTAERRVYGDELETPDANSRGRLRLQFDGAGRLSLGYDADGNVTASERTVLAAPERLVDWSGLGSARDAAALSRRAEEWLGEAFATTHVFDDLGRMTARTDPNGGRVTTRYGPRGLVSDVTTHGEDGERPALVSVAYDAAGRVIESRLGNGAHETAAYDDASGRLRRARVTGASGSLRDQTLTSDPIGNVLMIREAAQQTRFFRNAVVSADRSFSYDALYRLVTAHGREAAMGPPAPGTSHDPVVRELPAPNDLTAVRRYTDHFEWDLAGNLTSTRHAAGTGSFTVRYEISVDADRVVRLRDDAGGAQPDAYEYDASGNVVTLGALSGLTWDDDERLTEVDLQGGGTIHHTYDADGQRVHTVTIRRGGLREERVRTDGWDRWRRITPTGAVDSEVTTMHVGAGDRTLALVEQRRVSGTSDGAPTWRYQHPDHTGSITIETDAGGGVLSFEEYRPYGASAYRAALPTAPPKRFRFHGAEREDDTGLDQTGVRSYAPWLGRWISPDPGGMLDGTNRYWFSRGNPVSFADPTGFQSVNRSEMVSRNPSMLVYSSQMSTQSIGIHDEQARASRLLAGVSLGPPPLRAVGDRLVQNPIRIGTFLQPLNPPTAPPPPAAPAHAPRHLPPRRRHAAVPSPPATPQVAPSPPPPDPPDPPAPDPPSPSQLLPEPLQILGIIPYGEPTDIPELFPGLRPDPPIATGAPDIPIGDYAGEFMRRGGNHFLHGALGVAMALMLLSTGPVGWVAFFIALGGVASAFQFGYGAAELATSFGRDPLTEQRINRRGQTQLNMFTPLGWFAALHAVASGQDEEHVEAAAEEGSNINNLLGLAAGGVSVYSWARSGAPARMARGAGNAFREWLIPGAAESEREINRMLRALQAQTSSSSPVFFQPPRNMPRGARWSPQIAPVPAPTPVEPGSMQALAAPHNANIHGGSLFLGSGFPPQSNLPGGFEGPITAAATRPGGCLRYATCLAGQLAGHPNWRISDYYSLPSRDALHRALGRVIQQRSLDIIARMAARRGPGTLVHISVRRPGGAAHAVIAQVNEAGLLELWDTYGFAVSRAPVLGRRPSPDMGQFYFANRIGWLEPGTRILGYRILNIVPP